MSKNGATSALPTSAPAVEHLPTSSNSSSAKRHKRKTSKTRLPTPPPDPNLPQHETASNPTNTDKNKPSTSTNTNSPTSDKDAEIFAYLDCLQNELQQHQPPNQQSSARSLGRSTSVFAPAIAAEDAFDHLEKLYKMMEQMLSLREQNAKLRRRIRDLEHRKNLQIMQKQLELMQSTECLQSDVADQNESVYAERLLEAILLDSKKDTAKSGIPSRLRQSILRRQRNRSSSMGVEHKCQDFVDASTSSGFNKLGKRRASSPPGGADNVANKHAKVSKWTKVKAAFKWEKASAMVNYDAQQSAHGFIPVNCELARYLRVPSMNNDDQGTSITDSGPAENSTPGSISLSSSMDDIHGYEGRHNHKDQPRQIDYISSDDDQSYLHDYIPHSSKDDASTLPKSVNKYSKTAWAKMKDIIQTRNSLKKKHRLSAKSDDVKTTDTNLESDNEDVFLEEPKHPRIHFSDEIVSGHNISFSEDYDELCDDQSKHKHLHESKWSLVKKAFLTHHQNHHQYAGSSSSPSAEQKSDSFTFKKEEVKEQEEIERNYKQLQEKISLEFQEKFPELDKSKQPYTPTSVCSSPTTSSLLTHDEAKDPAFMKKMEEWKKLKSQPKQNVTGQNSSYQLTSEENLPPDFKKKLQEWQKIKKGSLKDEHTKKKPNKSSKNVCKSDIEQRPLSDEFIKKLETWKQLKAYGASNSYDEWSAKRSTVENKTPSPKIDRKDSGGRQNYKKLKDQTEKELQWFQKELNKIEREKQRLERERQKFLEREERLSKLRRSIIGNKKEVLVHTPSGIYRFEGISRKFTQKLYEWEKAQGIGPEASTITLLNRSYPYERPLNTTRNRAMKTLVRSKSADSIANSAMNILCPILSEQPSSLSLNDVQGFENNLVESRISSMRDMSRSDENFSPNEPQAVIIEVEDVVEETASPLESYLERREKAIYHQQEDANTKLLETPRSSSPKIHRSESARAQTNYNLIEKIIDLLKLMTENEHQIALTENQSINLNELILKDNINNCDEEKEDLMNGWRRYLSEAPRIFRDMYEHQKQLSSDLVEKLILLQQANNSVVSQISKETLRTMPSHLEEDLENVQDLSTELLQMGEKLEINAYNRYKHFSKGDLLNYTMKHYIVIPDTLSLLTNKILETRRILSYICAASDTTTPSRRKKLSRRNYFRKSSSLEQKTDKNGHNDEEDRKAGSDDNLRVPVGQGAIKKRIRYKQKEASYRTINDSDDEPSDTKKRFSKKSTPKIQVSFSSDDPFNKCDPGVPCRRKSQDEIVVDATILQKVVVPTKTTILTMDNLPSTSSSANKSGSDSPITVFVKTTRKLFTPIAGLDDVKLDVERVILNDPDNLDNSNSMNADINDEETHETLHTNSSKTADEEEILINSTFLPPITHLPPQIPPSPQPQRKFKEISPSIRLMLAKYNQKVEQESSGYKSGGSSGSASPVAWRSPVFERRVKAQTEKYQEGLNKMSPLLQKREVQKSASLGFINSGNKQLTVHRIKKCDKENTVGILKSSSVAEMQLKKTPPNKSDSSNLTKKTQQSSKQIVITRSSLIEQQEVTSPELRFKKLQKAKEDFLNSAPSPPLPPLNEPKTAPADLQFSKKDFLKYPARNRLSQISVGSDTSCDSSSLCGGTSLIKSASAGMIHVDPTTFKQFDPTVHADGYVSLPRTNSKKNKPSNIFNNITSKFRKVKMRRGHKEGQKTMNTISTLCRQSLVVDINDGAEGSSQVDVGDRKESLTVPSISGGSSSEDTSTPNSSRSGSWIRRAKFFSSKSK